ncbi:MAG: hypothetical protein ACR5KW_03535 [Wolbachia sp.]
MPIFKNHRGQFHKMNTAFVALTSLYVIGAAVALSSPYWVSSYPILTPLATFASTPLGMGILAFVAIALTSLAIRAISKNNEISEEKAPKITKDGLLLRRDVYEEMKKNNQVKDDNGNTKSGLYYIDFNLRDKNYRIIIGDKFDEERGNTLLFKTYSLEMKSTDSKYATVANKNKELEILGLKQSSDEINTYLGKLSSVTSVVQEQGQGQGQQ